VALELAQQLARERSVMVLGTSAHELDNFGIRAQLTAGLDVAPAAVLHVGASVAAGAMTGGALELSRGRLAAANRPSGADTPLGQALARGGYQPSPRFLGEGGEWIRHPPTTTPLLSLAGFFPLFHTPQDLPAAATSPRLLAQVYAAVSDALRALIA
jgi:hypothetical protein